MAIRHKTISEFASSDEDSTLYTERLKHYYLANDIDNNKNEGLYSRPQLIRTPHCQNSYSCCGPQTCQLIKNLHAPEKPLDKTLRLNCHSCCSKDIPNYPDHYVQIFSFNMSFSVEFPPISYSLNRIICMYCYISGWNRKYIYIAGASHRDEKWSGQTNYKYTTGPAQMYCSIGFIQSQEKVVRHGRTSQTACYAYAYNAFINLYTYSTLTQQL